MAQGKSLKTSDWKRRISERACGMEAPGRKRAMTGMKSPAQ